MIERRAITGVIGLACVLGMAAVIGAEPAPAPEVVTHVVTTTADRGPGSLRAALEAAAETPQADRIEFGDEDGPFSTPQSIELKSPLPAIDGEVTVSGHIRKLLWTAYGVTVSGAGRHRVFEVPEGATLRLAGITIVDGRAENGGAILNSGRLVIEGVTLLRNEAIESGGAIANDGGEALVINSTLSENRAARGGAVANLGLAELRVTHGTLYQNHAREGAALFNEGLLEMGNSILAGGDGEQCVNAGSMSGASTHNLITSHRGCGDPILQVDPRIGEFGFYNGPTQVFTLAMGSPVINLAAAEAAKGEDGEPLKWDQRGNGDPRFAQGYADLGAFEQQARLPTEFIVDTLEDTGLRACSTGGKADCPLRAALELAAAARNPTPIHFDPTVFSQPRTLRLRTLPVDAETEFLLDGKGAATVTIVLPVAPSSWQGVNGVRLESDSGSGLSVGGE